MGVAKVTTREGCGRNTSPGRAVGQFSKVIDAPLCTGVSYWGCGRSDTAPAPHSTPADPMASRLLMHCRLPRLPVTLPAADCLLPVGLFFHNVIVSTLVTGSDGQQKVGFFRRGSYYETIKRSQKSSLNVSNLSLGPRAEPEGFRAATPSPDGEGCRKGSSC